MSKSEDIEETVRIARTEAIQRNERTRIGDQLIKVENDMKDWIMSWQGVADATVPDMPHQEFPRTLAGIGQWVKDGAVIEHETPA